MITTIKVDELIIQGSSSCGIVVLTFENDEKKMVLCKRRGPGSPYVQWALRKAIRMDVPLKWSDSPFEGLLNTLTEEEKIDLIKKCWGHLLSRSLSGQRAWYPLFEAVLLLEETISQDKRPARPEIKVAHRVSGRNMAPTDSNICEICGSVYAPLIVSGDHCSHTLCEQCNPEDIDTQKHLCWLRF